MQHAAQRVGAAERELAQQRRDDLQRSREAVERGRQQWQNVRASSMSKGPQSVTNTERSTQPEKAAAAANLEHLAGSVGAGLEVVACGTGQAL